MLARPIVALKGMFQQAFGPRKILDQIGSSANATAGSASLTAVDVMSGILFRSGPVGGFSDTWPDADTLIAAMDAPQVGDSWILEYRNSVAQAMTYVAGTGIVSGTGTLTNAGSLTRRYLHTVLSNKRTTIKICTTTNASGVLSNVKDADMKDVMPGMGVSGTGIGASAIVLGCTYASPDANTITVSVVSTATADNIAVTFFPRIQLDSLGSYTA